MRNRWIVIAALVIALGGISYLMGMLVKGRSAARDAGPAGSSGKTLKTPWGEPDLQGIWTEEHITPLQRPAQFKDREFLTDAEMAAIDKEQAADVQEDPRFEIGTERDVDNAYSEVFHSVKRRGRRTSLIVDPPNGMLPPLTPEAEQKKRTEREYRSVLLQATEECKKQMPACIGGHYGPPSPKRSEIPPFYNTGRNNRLDGPEDRSLQERCIYGLLPDFAGFRRIVQSPGVVSIFYDTSQGQGWSRIIPVDSAPHPHLPPSFQLRWGDSRGHWEGNTLVVDVTNFSPRYSYQWSREKKHLVERWTRVDAGTIEYQVTIEDPTTWTKPWTVKQELGRQSDEANRIYYEPRCHEGNVGLPSMLMTMRVQEREFAMGKRPDPATENSAIYDNPDRPSDAQTDLPTTGPGLPPIYSYSEKSK